MGWKLNSRGDLTVHQKLQADAMGVSYPDYKEMTIKRYLELRGEIPPPTRRMIGIKKDIIESENPVLVVAAGPSSKKYLKEIRSFPGRVIVMDKNFNDCNKAGIIPDYISTLESGKHNVTKSMFYPDNLKNCKGKTSVFGSSITRKDIESHVKSNGIPFIRWISEDEPRMSNNGLHAVNFARNYLKADKIFIVGMEHTGGTYGDHTVRIWQVDFWYMVQKWPKETVINCTDGGVLYYEDYIIDTTLDKVKIVKARHNTPSSFELKQAA